MFDCHGLVFIFFYVATFMSFEKYNSNKTFMVVVYFSSVIRITQLLDYPM